MARLRQRVVALGLISLQLVVVGHMAFERHGLSTAGDVVELHDALTLHGHEERSLCEREADEGGSDGDALCHLGRVGALTSSPPGFGAVVTGVPHLLRLASRVVRVDRLWLVAPKASPPARG